MSQSNIQNEPIETQFTYVISKKPNFPGNLFNFKEYDGLKFIAVFILITSFIYFISSFISLLTNNHHTYSTIGMPSIWALLFQTLLKSLIQILHSTVDIFNIIIIATPLIISYFLAWVIIRSEKCSDVYSQLDKFNFRILRNFKPF